MAITVELDVTELVAELKAEGTGLFAGVMHHLVGAAQTVAPLRQRIRLADGDDPGPDLLGGAPMLEHVVEHDRVDPGFTVAVSGDRFNVATVPYTDDRAAFAAAVADESERLRDQGDVQPFDGLRDDLLYMSCLPWLRFTSLTHPVHTERPDTTPRIAWGRIETRDGRRTMPVNIQAHHALVDGVHLAAFFGAAQR
jgi:chloramphenicol O-acetyltransferase type A